MMFSQVAPVYVKIYLNPLCTLLFKSLRSSSYFLKKISSFIQQECVILAKSASEGIYITKQYIIYIYIYRYRLYKFCSFELFLFIKSPDTNVSRFHKITKQHNSFRIIINVSEYQTSILEDF